LSDQRLTGVLAVCHDYNKAVATSAKQTPPPDIGISSFEFWTPKRRPAGNNFAMKIEPPLEVFQREKFSQTVWRGRQISQTLGLPTLRTNNQLFILNGLNHRPSPASNSGSIQTSITRWNVFLLIHPERVMPFCVPEVVCCDGSVFRGREFDPNYSGS